MVELVLRPELRRQRLLLRCPVVEVREKGSPHILRRLVVVASILVIVAIISVAAYRLFFRPQSTLDVAEQALAEVKLGHSQYLIAHADPAEAAYMPMTASALDRLLNEYVLPAVQQCQKAENGRREQIEPTNGSGDASELYTTKYGSEAELMMQSVVTPHGVKLVTPISDLMSAAGRMRHAFKSDRFVQESALRAVRMDAPLLESMGFKGRFQGGRFYTWKDLERYFEDRVQVLSEKGASASASRQGS
jgi:hypothetical protein